MLGRRKEGSPPIYDHVDAPEGRCRKRNQPDAEKQTVPDLTHVWNLKESNGWKQRTDWWLSGPGGRGKGEMRC